MDTCRPRPTGTSFSPSRPTVAPSPSISKSAGTSSTHSLQMCRYDHRPHKTSCTQAPTSCMHMLAGCPHTVAGTSTLSSACRYTRCAPRWAPASRRRCCGHAPITILPGEYRSTGRKSGFMTWRLLHLPDRASSPLLLTMPAARHVGLHRARDHRDPRGRLCGRHGRYGRPRAA